MSDLKFVDREKLNTFLYNNQQTAAILSKPLRKAPRTLTRDASEYARIHSETKAMSTDIHGEFGKLFFDLDVAVEILIGLMLSPKGSVKPELIFSTQYSVLPASAIGAIIKDLPNYFNETYKLSSNLSKMLKKVLYSHGAVAKVIIPESIVDKIVNNNSPLSAEVMSYVSPSKDIPLKGILKNYNSNMLGMEGYGYAGSAGPSLTMPDFGLTITDNFDLLSTPKLRKYIAQRQTESYISPFASHIDADWKFAATDDYLDVSAIEADRESVGLPLYLEVDSAAITPIHIPGDPTKHTCYLMLLDENGYVVSPKDLREEIEEMYQELPSTPMGKSLANTAKGNLNRFGTTKFNSTQLLNVFTSQVNAHIQKMLATAGQTRDLTFSEVNATYASILARAMKDKQTRLLLLPVEMVAYYAFEYDSNGVGVTLLHDLPTLSSMRASLLFSGLVSEVKNNIPQTKVNITLDENDPDPDSSLEMIQSNTLERQANLTPIGLVNITDWTEWAHRSGFSFQVEEHPRLPNTKVEYEDVTPQRLIPSDSTLYESIRAQEIMSIGVTPEMVDNGFASDFASTDAAKRIQLARRIASRQLTLSDLLTDEVRKLSLADANILKLVKERLDGMENLSTYLTDEYKTMWRKNKQLTLDKLALDIIRSVVVSLPNPDTDNVEIMLANLQKYSEMLDLAIESWFNEGFLGGSEEEQLLVDNAAVIRTALKAHYMRRYMIKNGYLAELSEMVSFNDKGTPMIDLEEEMSAHVKGLVAMASNYLRNFKPRADSNVETPVEEVPVEASEDETSAVEPEPESAPDDLTESDGSIKLEKLKM